MKEFPSAARENSANIPNRVSGKFGLLDEDDVRVPLREDLRSRSKSMNACRDDPNMFRSIIVRHLG